MESVKGCLSQERSLFTFLRRDASDQRDDCLFVSVYRDFKVDVQTVSCRDVIYWKPLVLVIQGEFLNRYLPGATRDDGVARALDAPAVPAQAHAEQKP